MQLIANIQADTTLQFANAVAEAVEALAERDVWRNEGSDIDVAIQLPSFIQQIAEHDVASTNRMPISARQS